MVGSSGWGGPAAKEILANLWTRVTIDAPPDGELASIVEASYPALKLLVPRMIGRAGGQESTISPVSLLSSP